MVDTMTLKNINLSSLDTLYRVKQNLCVCEMKDIISLIVFVSDRINGSVR
jgi:hypothetical protein